MIPSRRSVTRADGIRSAVKAGKDRKGTASVSGGITGSTSEDARHPPEQHVPNLKAIIRIYTKFRT